MPLLDFANSQASLQNQLCRPRIPVQKPLPFVPCKFLSTPFTSGDHKRLLSLCNPFRLHTEPKLVHHDSTKLIINAVATLEPKCVPENNEKWKSYSSTNSSSDPSNVELEFLNVDLLEFDEREKLRRLRISKANKGNTPWNKGRKHSAETRQRIKEKTRLAMQDPKVKMKLARLGHAQSNETKKKIAVGVRRGWEKRREKLMLQETCYFQWQNLIAEAARKGYDGEEELQWYSYEKLSDKLEVEWVESVVKRKTTPRPKGNKRAPKSLEQRRKIAEAIAGKWADPEYRQRVCSGLAKYHGIPDGVARKPRRYPSDGTRYTRKKRSSSGSDSSDIEIKTPIQRMRLRRSNTPLYKDPLASSKLEMIKNIRAQRAVSESKKIEAIKRARLLIAEAEKAADALEVAATRSPIAQASLLETRKLIAEAIQWLESIDAGNIIPNKNGTDKRLSHIETKTMAMCNGGFMSNEVDGIKVVEPREDEDDFILRNVNSQPMPNGQRKEILPSNQCGIATFDLENLLEQSTRASSFEPNMNVQTEMNHVANGSTAFDLRSLLEQSTTTNSLEPNVNIETETNHLVNGSKVINSKEKTPSNSACTTKKWFRGRLVEVTE